MPISGGTSISPADVWNIARTSILNLASIGAAILGLTPLAQLTGATPGGTFTTTPQNLFDADIATQGLPGAVDQYAECTFGALCQLHDFRIYWSSLNGNENGRWKIAYQDISGAWVDIKTDIPTIDASAWTEYEMFAGLPIATGIRFISTTYDAGSRQLYEFEIRGAKLE